MIGRAATALLITAGGLVTMPAAPASAAGGTCADQYVLDQTRTRYDSTQDIDDDALSDLVVGVPAATMSDRARAGAVDVHYDADSSFADELTADPRTQRIDESDFTGLPAPAAGDEFGSAVAVADVNGDYCEDLAIGARGADDGRGAVIVALGSKQGVSPRGAVLITGRTAGEHFGTAIAADGNDAWIGAPNRTVAGQPGAGAIDHYRLTAAGATLVQTITEATPGVPGTAEAGDHFGQVIAAGDPLAVGEPDEDIGTAANAGAVTFIATSEHGIVATKITENSAHIAGVAEGGDRFGASVAIQHPGADAPTTAAIGVPGEDGDAGRAELVALDRHGRAVRSLDIREGAGGIPGRPQADDDFGAAVLMWSCPTPNNDDLECLAIGAPGEGIGNASGAGAIVDVRFDDGASSGDPILRLDAVLPTLRQGSGGAGSLGGRPETGDRAGAGLATLADTDYADEEGNFSRGGSKLVIAVPGEDIGDVPDAGDLVITPGTSHYFVPYTNVHESVGSRASDRYGVPASTLTLAPWVSESS